MCGGGGGFLLLKESLMMLLSGAQSLISLTDRAGTGSMNSFLLSVSLLGCAFMCVRGERRIGVGVVKGRGWGGVGGVQKTHAQTLI